MGRLGLQIGLFLKGFVIGAANVVPGVSGGTMAFLLGVYERLIAALGAFGLPLVKELRQGRIGVVWQRIDGAFLTSLFLGVLVSVVTLARVLKWGFEHHPRLVWAVFCGLILASLPALCARVGRWSWGCRVALLLGAVSTAGMVILRPGMENASWPYLALCGVVAMCSMITPGISGSFILLLMGNYELVMIDAVNALSSMEWGKALGILVPVGLGAGVGLLLFVRLLQWLFQHHHDLAVASIVGIVLGSLVIIWPWKDEVTQTFARGDEVKVKTVGYTNWRLPQVPGDWMSLGAVVFGGALMWGLERSGRGRLVEGASVREAGEEGE